MDLHDLESCPGCGLHESITSDPDNAFMPEPKVCPVCKGQDRYQRVLSDADDEAVKALGENPDPKAVRPSDGRHIYLRRMTPQEVEARKNQQGRADGRPPRKRPS